MQSTMQPHMHMGMQQGMYPGYQQQVCNCALLLSVMHSVAFKYLHLAGLADLAC